MYDVEDVKKSAPGKTGREDGLGSSDQYSFLRSHHHSR